MRAFLRLLVILALLAPLALAAELWDTEEGRERVFNALVTIFEEHYWNPDHLDWSAWADRHHDEVIAATTRSTFDASLRRMVRELADDHSNWAGLPESAESRTVPAATPPRLGFLAEYLAGEGLVIRRILPGGPADLAGLRRGDVVLEAAGQVVEGNQQFRTLLDGLPPGEILELRVRRKRDLFSINVRPGSVAASGLRRPQGEMLTGTTGYLYVPTFQGDGVAMEAHRIIAELQAEGARSLVLDLRGNLGGRLAEMSLLLGAFIEGPWGRAVSQGEVVWQGRFERGDDTGRSVLEAPDGTVVRSDQIVAPARFDGSLAVLVDTRNSSAGEVAALALQDLGRAKIIGEATLGNVEAVRAFGLPDGSRVFVAVANLESAAGAPFSFGVVPDVIAREDLGELARGYDAPVSEALRELGGLPFTPNKLF